MCAPMWKQKDDKEMSECGGCRHWEGFILMSEVGICEREDWVEHGGQLANSHRGHILSFAHPAPPCYERREKDCPILGDVCLVYNPPKKRKSIRRAFETLCPGEQGSFVANEDIKKDDILEVARGG